MAKQKVSTEIQAYIRSLSSLCRNDSLAYYFTLYNFGKLQEGFLGKKRLRKELSKLGIVDYTSFKYRLNWLKDDGWRSDYQKMSSFLATLSETDRKKYIESFSKEHEDYPRLFIVHYYMNKVPVEGIIAFDYAWHIYLCRAGWVLGYLSNEEAWKLMLDAAHRLQTVYSSWNEFVTAFVCGSQFREADTSFSFVKKNANLINKLFASSTSPMVQIDWNLDLLQK
ncbi:DUF1266 domain-containing protein [Bacillus suaedaesalsae]|uniref:DUF1266 domain-containing protein n=1 Tax=Bacillus suaedaesalsae TaxID=2810349 RepID=A0ABS2DGD4_9BACI|nr:DUF1266 domain-containing protein [Bacillus suaedaesalsae]MBM6616603.1 DUF1266 domain-containing protein [Bacillus suaedaesalsae]